jgi:cation:H+ antiporter
VGVVLLALFVTYMLYTVWQVRKNPTALNEESIPAEVPQEETAASKKRVPALLVELVLLAVGAAAIAVGADLLVDNGTLIAEALGVPESVIALTFVALGTSLPELVTAVTSLIKGHGALSLGNVIGANLFNLVLVSGVSVALSPFDVPVSQTVAGHNASLVLDIPLMLGVMAILTLPALFRGKLSRVQGVVLLALYAAFCTVQFLL